MKLTMQREYGVTENGNDMFGRWVLRDEKGVMVDIDKYQTDIFERWESKGAKIIQIGH